MMTARQPPLRARRAIAAYQHQMAQRTGWIYCLRRGSGWLEPLLAPLLPLRDGPLMGVALTELAVLTSQLDEARPQRMQRPKGRAARQSTSSLRGRLSLPLVDTPLTPVPRVAADAPIAARSHSKRAASLTSPLQGAPETALMPSLPLGKLSPGRHITQSSAVGSARLAAGLPRQAHSALLAPFAGTAAREVTNRVPRRRSLGAAKSAPERLFQPGDLAERVANHWRTPLAARVAHIISRANRLLLSEPEAGAREPIEGAWATRLSGPTAALAVLTRYAHLAPASAAHGGPPSRVEETVTAARSGSPLPQALSSFTPDEVHGVHTLLITEDGTPFAPSLWGMLDFTGSPSALATPLPDHESTVSVVNPTLASRLPYLTPAEPGTAWDLPIAAATARHGALVEATAEEDLDALAAKLKRILNEEARRHGIQV